ncbi:ABC transporter ATP-binding protein [Halorhodospira abdelmalekii]|uniref:ABC transporter ATP-binding protein n=1 Tax=Halorhodospira abdelmalekii TaxID=421629 RepID=UPI0019065DDD|nr:ATP-binding cassette domain-containing protein [Halorhodospira abdelmalekii]MBK1735373.1 ABC transporter ATP-binding protein [Halorhodospira abdelmalekii]
MVVGAVRHERDEAPDEAAITVEGLTTRLGGRLIHEALDLKVRRGEILGVVGGSGSGKSVLLRTLIGLIRPVGGRVQILGRSLFGPGGESTGIERRVGVLFQHGALYSSLTAADNVALLLREHYDVPPAAAVELARLQLALTGLGAEAWERYPAELSGGMVKRAALARALVLNPPLLFLDEPTAGLDPISAAEFDALLVTLRDALDLTVFLVTHDLDTLYAACDRVAVLAQRRVLTVGTLDVVAATEEPWIQAYFNGPRGRRSGTLDSGRAEREGQ